MGVQNLGLNTAGAIALKGLGVAPAMPSFEKTRGLSPSFLNGVISLAAFANHENNVDRTRANANARVFRQLDPNFGVGQNSPSPPAGVMSGQENGLQQAETAIRAAAELPVEFMAAASGMSRPSSGGASIPGGGSGNPKALAAKSNSPYALFNDTHAGSQPVPKGLGPNGGPLQSHHGLQQEWAANNIPGYRPGLGPTVTLENGKGLPHTVITTLQRQRRDARVAAGLGKWSSSIDDELGFIVSDFRKAGFGDDVIKQVLEQNYKMLDKLGVKHTKPTGF